MEKSPLQMYKRAYDLHYKENDLLKASKIYRELIENFPNSDVSVYASIQLSKIQSHNLSEEIPNRKRSPGRLVLVLLIINLILTAGVICGLVMHVQIVNNRQEAISKLSRTVGKLYTGKEEEALDILSELKVSTKNDITPYSISADIYCKNNDFIKARKEYEMFGRFYPGNALVTIGIKKINKEEDTYIKTSKKLKEIKDTISAKKVEKPVKKKYATPYREPEPRKRISTDDISYF